MLSERGQCYISRRASDVARGSVSRDDQSCKPFDAHLFERSRIMLTTDADLQSITHHLPQYSRAHAIV
jgi:hypothetical protein